MNETNDQPQIIKRLDSCDHLYLISFAQGDESFTLQVEVIEARADTHRWNSPASVATDDAKSDDDAVRDTMLKGSRAIAPVPGCAHFTITFEEFVMFAVRDESFAKPEEDEDFSPKLRTHKHSTLLDYFKKSSREYWDIEGPVKHMSVVCLDRIVDVICRKDPVIFMRITDQSEYD